MAPRPARSTRERGNTMSRTPHSSENYQMVMTYRSSVLLDKYASTAYL